MEIQASPIPVIPRLIERADGLFACVARSNVIITAHNIEHGIPEETARLPKQRYRSGLLQFIQQGVRVYTTDGAPGRCIRRNELPSPGRHRGRLACGGLSGATACCRVPRAGGRGGTDRAGAARSVWSVPEQMATADTAGALRGRPGGRQAAWHRDTGVWERADGRYSISPAAGVPVA